MKLSTLCLLLFISLASSAQNGFEKLYGGSSNEIAQSVSSTSDGGYIIAGKTHSFGPGIPANGNFHLVKTDSNGVELWSKYFGFNGDDRGFKAFEIPSGGGYIIAGDAINPATNSDDIYVVKTNSIGDTVWTHFYGGASTDLCFDAIPLTGGNMLLGGSTFSFGSGGDIFLLKINASGSVIWQQNFGGSYVQIANAVKKTADGGFIVCGFTNPSGGNVYNFYLAKTDSMGAFTWGNNYGGPYSDYGQDVVQNADGGYTMTGWKQAYVDSSQAYLIRTNSVGTMIWQKNIGRRTGDQAYGLSAIPGGYLVTGYTQTPEKLGDMLFVKTNLNGDTIFTKQYGGTHDDFGNSIIPVNNKYVIAGASGGFGANDLQAYLVLADTFGNVPCPATTSYITSPVSICEDELVHFINTTVNSNAFSWKQNGNTFGQNVDAYYLFPSGGTYTIDLEACNTPQNSSLTIHSKPNTNFTYTTSGNSVTFTMAGGLNPQSHSWNFGDGSPVDTTNLNPVHVYASLGMYWIILSVTNTDGCDSTIIQQINIIPSGINEVHSFDIMLFPNPAGNDLQLLYNAEGIKTIEFYDVFGKMILSQKTSGNQTLVNISGFADGFYFLKVTNATGEVVIKKFLKQQ